MQWFQNKKEGTERKLKTAPVNLLGKEFTAFIEYAADVGKWAWRIDKKSRNLYLGRESTVSLLLGWASSIEEAKEKVESNFNSLIRYFG